MVFYFHLEVKQLLIAERSYLQTGVFEKYNVKVLGTPVRAIMDTEDRELFVNKLNEINVKTPSSIAVNTVEEALEAADKLGFPIIIRALILLGGQGSGFCYKQGRT